jgi:F-type H+-transporting ATPase subunit gamma
MATLETLRRQVEGTEDLQSIVGAMKSISAVRIRQFRAVVDALREYSHTLELGLQIALRDARAVSAAAPPESPAVAILFGADQGLAGQFNVRLLEVAHGDLERTVPRVSVFAVGARVTAQLEAEGRPPDERFSAPAGVDGIADVVHGLLLAIDDWRETARSERFTLYFNEYTGGASYEPRRVELLPIDRAWIESLRGRPWEGPSLPTFHTDWRTLFARLVREYLFIGLFRACAESLASENASRLSAMESAESRIEERLAELRQRFNHRRQQSITEELLEVVAGFEALKEEES